MDSDTGDLVKAISRTVSARHTVDAMIASVMTLLLYDWLLILPQEVKYIWRAEWNWSKVVYLLTRYIPFISVTLELRNHFSSNPSPESCKKILRVTGCLAFIGMGLAEAILAIRTWAVWNRDKRVGIGLTLLLGLYYIPDGMILFRFIQEIGYTQNPYPELYNGCAYNKATKLIYAIWIMITIVEGVVLVLMVVSAVKTCRPLLDVSSLWTINNWTERKSNLLYVVYRDGIRFYLYMFCATLANVLVTLLLPIDFVSIGSDMEVILHSILICRLMIGIREASQSHGHTFELSEVPHHSNLEFARRSSGESA